MNEADTKAELIEPQLKASGWGVVESSKILREFSISPGKIQTGGVRAKPLKADYVLVYKSKKLAVLEAKSDQCEVGEGIAQAKNYAEKLCLETTYASNGKQIYQICMKTGTENLIANFPTPEELWNKTFEIQNLWQEKFNQVLFEDVGGTKPLRYYQEIAINKVMSAIADGKNRILLTLATGTGKTFIAFQIAWKLFQSRWNLNLDGARQPRILFLADRNILANQAMNDFSVFPEDACVRIDPSDIRKKGNVPKNGSMFFTIFQTFTANGKDSAPNFGQYAPDYFDFIIIDECHRGGANDESTWRGILEYFSPAVQLGLTATPKRENNMDTYRYFGDPVYIYALKDGIEDGFLTPFKVKKIQTTLDEYIYTSDDQVVEGEIEAGKVYEEKDFNRIIEIEAREKYRVERILENISEQEKTIIFCANQTHALVIRDLINQKKKNKNPNYCVRVTANDGALGEQYLREFQDNEKIIPTILTTSQKLSTGVNAHNVRNIVLLRPVNSMIEFKQIIGRGTRLFDGKDFFTIYDFVGASRNFSDPEWDGEPIEPESHIEEQKSDFVSHERNHAKKESVESLSELKIQKVKIKLRDGKEREIQHMISTSFWSSDGKPISFEEFFQNLYGALPTFFKNEEELREIWSIPTTRKAFLENLGAAGYGKDELATLQKMIHAENSDLFDVLEFVSFNVQPMTREARVAKAQSHIFSQLNAKQKEFLQFVLFKYIETGVEELDQEKLPRLLELKYFSLTDAKEELGDLSKIGSLFQNCQKFLYLQN